MSPKSIRLSIALPMHFMHYLCMSTTAISKEARNIARQIAATGRSQTQVARDLGVNQSQISRLLAGQMKRRTKLFSRLCIYAEATKHAVDRPTGAEDELFAALRDMWDGSAGHAAALSDALRAIAALKSFEHRKQQR